VIGVNVVVAAGITAAEATYGYLQASAYKPPFNTGQVAQQIANGHAWEQHAQQFASLGAGDEGDFRKFIKKILDKPSRVRKLTRGRLQGGAGRGEAARGGEASGARVDDPAVVQAAWD
jgi:hypothetical protein